jgi:hypothetical protein
MGAIGMTYEQAGHGRAGLGITNDEGFELTLIDRIAHHTTTGLSTVEMASGNAQKLNTEFIKFFKNTDSKYKSYVLQGDKNKIEALKTLLDKHEIAYGYAGSGKVSGYDYGSNTSGNINTSSKDLIISTNQPKGKMVKVLFEPNTKLSDSITYDITAWSAPYAYGLNGMASSSLVSSSAIVNTSTLNTISTSATGYILEWKSMKDAEFLTELLKQKIKVRFSEKPFTVKSPEQTFDRGSLIVIRGDNKAIENFDDKVIEAANKFNRILVAVNTGFSKTGPDFGSPDVKLVSNQKVAILSGNYTSSLSYGELWHFFEQQLKYPITSINTEDFGQVNLAAYNVLIIPNGYYSRLLDEDNLKKLKTYVSNGGKVIAIDGALNSFADKEGFGLKRNKTKDSTEVKTNLIPYAQRERNDTKNLITGAVFKTKVDTTHPMAFGYDNDYFTLKLGNDSYSLLESGYNIAYLGDKPRPVSGYAGKDALKGLDNSLVFGEENIGSGSMLYFVDNVMFRSFWENGKLFLVNAVFFVNNNSYEL